MESQELIKVGKIVGTHGYKGTVRVESLTDFPERFKREQKLNVGQGPAARELTLETCGFHRGQLLMKFKEIESMEEAASYRDKFISITADDLYPLPEGSYYQFQLIGLRVEDLEKGYLGELTDILETGANDVYVVKSDVYGEILIPAIKQVIQEVDLSSQCMRVKLLPGLLGEDE
ncbi:MAG: ribosome maturation factor RimM [Syntrophomonadaceae bacterium]|nr:ribosome maturation factor RimM [Syntrophomonadaceae bacterium]